MAWAEALGAALLMAPLWVLASVAAWECPMRCRGVAVAVAVAVGVAVGVGVGVSSSHRGKNVDPTPTVDVVWRSCIAAQGGSDMNSRVI